MGTETQRVEYRPIGIGESLLEAAYKQGYWQGRRGTFICKDCRHEAGEANRRLVRQEMRSCPRDPFERALITATQGLLYTKLNLSYGQIVEGWLGLNITGEQVEFASIVTPASHKRNWLTGSTRMVRATTRNVKGAGWIFPDTVQIEVRNGLGDTVLRWAGTTIILADGRVYAERRRMVDLEKIVHPHTLLHLIVEMARKVAAQDGRQWLGPDPGWN